VLSAAVRHCPSICSNASWAFGAELHNLYGPTEAIDVTAWACKRGVAGRVVPIGSPIANVQIYLLDAELRLVQLGYPANFTSAAFAWRRHFNRPELTAESLFNPFSDEPGRLYGTGDIEGATDQMEPLSTWGELTIR